MAIHSARLDLGGLIDSLAHTEGNPPLYFVLLDGWMRVFGDSEAATRSLSAIFGTATIVLAYEIGRRLATRRIGLVAAALVAFNPLLVWFSQETRPYALLVLLAGLSFLAFAEALERPSGRVLSGWALASGLALATHYFAALVVVPEIVWLLLRVRPRRRLLPPLAGLALVPLALIPLVATQGQVQDYSFVKGESLLTRVFAQVPKQWLVGYDAPTETLTVVLSALAVAGAAWLALTRTEGREREQVRLGATIGLSALGIAFALAVLGGDYYLSRYVLAAWLPLALVAAAGLGARRSGRLGLAVAAAACAVGVFVVLSVNGRPELQRDDWRGIARTLGPATRDRAIVVSPINGSLPLSLYLPGLRRLPAGGVRLMEIDAVAVAQREPGGTRRAPPVPIVKPPDGFTELARHQGKTFTVVRYHAGVPIPVTPSFLGGVPLEPGAPDYMLQPGP